MALTLDALGYTIRDARKLRANAGFSKRQGRFTSSGDMGGARRRQVEHPGALVALAAPLRAAMIAQAVR
jgi:hypothetical protein